MNRRMIIQWCVLFVIATACAWTAPARTAAPADTEGDVTPGFYFGHVAFHDDVIGLSVARNGRVKVFLTDAQPKGDAEWFEGRLRGDRLKVRSVSGRSRVAASFQKELALCTGSVKLPDGKTRRFAATRAGEGAGLYNIEVGGGSYSGKNSTGDRVDARLEGQFLVGTLTEANGTEIPFKVMDLSKAFQYRIAGAQPDRYTAIISRNATLHFGRGGAVKKGRPGRNLIAFDIPVSSDPTPGFFFGRVGFERDVIGIKIDLPAKDGTRRVRGYESDSEPGGDLQWFPGVLAKDNTFDIQSASGDARLQGSLDGDVITGVLHLPGGRARPYFALAAGEGAGIYDVTVNADGSLNGASEEGGVLIGQQDGDFVNIEITSPQGDVYLNRPSDLTRALDYPVKGNVPDTYVAIVAPRGRFIFGRSGLVRGGTPGLNIIGLDKLC